MEWPSLSKVGDFLEFHSAGHTGCTKRWHFPPQVSLKIKQGTEKQIAKSQAFKGPRVAFADVQWFRDQIGHRITRQWSMEMRVRRKTLARKLKIYTVLLSLQSSWPKGQWYCRATITSWRGSGKMMMKSATGRLRYRTCWLCRTCGSQLPQWQGHCQPSLGRKSLCRWPRKRCQEQTWPSPKSHRNSQAWRGTLYSQQWQCRHILHVT